MRVTQTVSALILPALFLTAGLLMLFSRKDLSAAFLSGAREGMESTFRLLPTLVLLLCAVSMFTASGAGESIASFLSPLCDRIGVPSELIPLCVLRPVSGSGSSALLLQIYETFGADSFLSYAASVLAGSGDTVVYILTVYFAATAVKKTRHAFPAAFLTMLFNIVLSCFLARLFYGG